MGKLQLKRYFLKRSDGSWGLYERDTWFNKSLLVLSIILITIGILVGLAIGQDKTYDYEEPEKEVKEDIFDEEWEIADSDDILKYNIMEDRWEFADPDDDLEYDVFEDEWEF